MKPTTEEIHAQNRSIYWALQMHHHVDTPTVQRALETLRDTLEKSPEHRTEEARYRYRARALDAFNRAVESDRFNARYVKN